MGKIKGGVGKDFVTDVQRNMHVLFMQKLLCNIMIEISIHREICIKCVYKKNI
jgi:hypothetical protein